MESVSVIQDLYQCKVNAQLVHKINNMLKAHKVANVKLVWRGFQENVSLNAWQMKSEELTAYVSADNNSI